MWLRVHQTMHFFPPEERESICHKGIRLFTATKFRSPNFCRSCRIAKHNSEGLPTIMVVDRKGKLVEVPRPAEEAREVSK